MYLYLLDVTEVLILSLGCRQHKNLFDVEETLEIIELKFKYDHAFTLAFCQSG